MNIIRKLFRLSLAVGISLSAYSVVLLDNNVSAQSERTTNDLILPASEGNSDSTSIEDNYFKGLDDSEKVLKLPNGGYIGGAGTFEERDLDGNLINTYNVLENPQSETVAEAKEKIKNEANEEFQSISLFSAYLPAWNSFIKLPLNGWYRSNPFSAKGWRFGEHYFVPEHGTGAYLRWSTYGDDGRIGNDILQAPPGFVYNPNTMTIPLYRGEYRYLESSYSTTWGYSGQYYCTYNPIPGSYYLVENI